ncbi:protein-tyrosine phosphatase-like protein [Terfezia claveryi]|nr:protein-tyrosine phosphatase-like protein [Terfezia claveryi]
MSSITTSRSSATPLTTVHPPATPSVKQHNGTTSPAAGYFGLVVDPSESTLSINHAKHNWSPSVSSIKSTAAKSPRPVTLEGLPEGFQKQAQALAFTLHHQNLSNASELGGYSSTSEFSGEKSSLGPSSPSSYSPSHSFTETNNAGSSNPPYSQGLKYFDKPRIASPFSMEVETYTRPYDNLAKNTAFSFPGLPLNGPVFQRKQSSPRSATLPMSQKEKEADITMIYPDALAPLLKKEKGNVMLIDLRTYPQYSMSRIKGAVHLCIPTTLLKRPSFNVQKLSETFANETDKARFAGWRDAKYIIVYDTDSQSSKEAMSAIHTVSKFIREGWTGHAYCIKGGFVAFAATYPGKIDNSDVETPSSPKSLSLTAGGGSTKSGGAAAIGGFNCALPPQTSIMNPFFSNIRQNMDLIGGVGEIPVTVPSLLQSEGRPPLPTWLKEIASENGAKLVSERFLAIEEAEKERMQKALNVSVTYNPDPTRPSMEPTNRHMLAGVEKGQKNRYNNIWPYDHTRVKLKDYPVDSCDYINASYIKSSRSKKRYIATQGPLPSTYQDFWSVVWDQDVRVIVMLTAESEGGQVKCHPYWVDERYGPLVLTKRSEELVSLEKKDPKGSTKRRSTTGSALPLPASNDTSVPHIIVRRFSLQHDHHPFHPIREITQLQYASWPDFGAPAHPAHILALIEHTDAVVRSTRGQKSTNPSTLSLSPLLGPPTPRERPAIVHCSAGCGRTGTFCAVDTVIHMIRRQQIHQQYGNSTATASDYGSDTDSYTESSDNEWMNRDDEDLICQVVSDFRDQRLSMVQSLRQFVLCYETVLEWISRQKPIDSGKRKA